MNAAGACRVADLRAESAVKLVEFVQFDSFAEKRWQECVMKAQFDGVLVSVSVKVNQVNLIASLPHVGRSPAALYKARGEQHSFHDAIAKGTNYACRQVGAHGRN